MQKSGVWSLLFSAAEFPLQAADFFPKLEEFIRRWTLKGILTDAGISVEDFLRLP